jgi:hypothetical protein
MIGMKVIASLGLLSAENVATLVWKFLHVYFILLQLSSLACSSPLGYFCSVRSKTAKFHLLDVSMLGSVGGMQAY